MGKDDNQIELHYSYIIGESKRMHQIYGELASIISCNYAVLIQGETGTGKELIASAVHYNGPRSEYPLVPVNCAAIPDTLVESELFGHEKGAFTGASVRRIGRFQQAHHGSLFLDEVGKSSTFMQYKLLRVVENRRLQSVGSDKLIDLDVRLFSAASEDLNKLVEEGFFSEELYYRLNVLTIKLPALRERIDDIPLLVEYFLRDIAEEMKTQKKDIDKEAMQLLINYRWPGNIRELRNALTRMTVCAEGNIITKETIEKHGKFRPTKDKGATEKNSLYESPPERRQTELLRLLRGGRVNYSSYKERFNKSRNTLQRDINILKRKMPVNQIGKGRRTYYVLKK